MASETSDFFAQLREVFNLCDEENRGYLNVDQLRELGRKHLGGQDENMLVSQMDPGGRGLVTFNDFCKGVAHLMTMQGGAAAMETNASIDGAVFVNTPPRLVIGASSGDLGVAVVVPGSPTVMPGDDDRIENSGSASSSLGSPDSDSALRSPYLSDREERFECYGEGDDLQTDVVDGALQDTAINKPSLSSDSFRSTSSTGSLGSDRHGRHGNNNNNNGGLQPRNTWLRSSLRRQSGSSKRLSSNALASQLFRTPPGGHSLNHSLNSGSRRSSISCDSDEMYTDQLSLEDDVLDLNQKVSELQHQISTLSENQNNTDDRYCRVKQENAALLHRIHNLEEQIRELEVRSEERMREEERRFKDTMVRQDREKSQELEHFTTRLYNLQQEHLGVKEELLSLRSQTERLRLEKQALGDELGERSSELFSLREDHLKLQELARRQRDDHLHQSNAGAQLLNEVTQELEELRRFCRDTEASGGNRSRSPSALELPARYQEMNAELSHLRQENKGLREANEELQAQLLNTSLAEGRILLQQQPACQLQGSSIAEEFDNFTKDQLRETLREQQDVNSKLRAYIDGILLNIVENYPQLLEVKANVK